MYLLVNRRTKIVKHKFENIDDAKNALKNLGIGYKIVERKLCIN